MIRWNKRCTIERDGPVGPRRIRLSVCRTYRLVHSQTSEFHQDLQDRFHATVARPGFPGCWNMISSHRSEGAARKACERHARLQVELAKPRRRAGQVRRKGVAANG